MYCVNPEEEHKLEVDELCETIVKLSNRICELGNNLVEIEKVTNQWTLENGRVYPFHIIIDEIQSIIKHSVITPRNSKDGRTVKK